MSIRSDQNNVKRSKKQEARKLSRDKTNVVYTLTTKYWFDNHITEKKRVKWQQKIYEINGNNRKQGHNVTRK